MEATYGRSSCEVILRLYWFKQQEFLKTREALVHIARAIGLGIPKSNDNHIEKV
jgi:hypothetical protein